VFYLWRNLGKPTRKRKSRKLSSGNVIKRSSGNVHKRSSGNSHKRTSGYSPKIQPYPTVTVTVEVIVQTEKALRIKNDRDETAWIPKIWVITKKELSEHTWEIEIEKQNWKDKFPGKPKESLSPRSNHSKGKQKIDRPPTPTVTATVEIVRQSDKAILIKNERGETTWIPKYWVIKKTELSEHTWEIEIERQNWKDKFPGKPKERLSPRSNHSKGKQKVDPTPIPTVTATVEIVRQTEKAILIKNDRGETAWIPKYWVIKKTELSEHTWQIEIKKQQWEEKFSGKPKERLSPRSRHQKSKG